SPPLKLAMLLQRLDRREDMPGTDRLAPIDEELPERSVLEHVAVGAQGLLQDLLAMRDEEDRRLVGLRGAKALVVQRSHDGLASSRSGDQQIAVAVVYLSLGGEVIEHLDLVRVRPYIEVA